MAGSLTLALIQIWKENKSTEISNFLEILTKKII